MATRITLGFATLALAAFSTPAWASEEVLGLVSLPNGRVGAEVRGITRDCGYRVYDPTSVTTTATGYLVSSPDIIPPPCYGPVLYPYSVVADIGFAEPNRDVRWVQGTFDRTVRTPAEVETLGAVFRVDERGQLRAGIALPNLNCGIEERVISVTVVGTDVIVRYDIQADANGVVCFATPPPLGLSVPLNLPPGSYILRTIGTGLAANTLPLRAPFVSTGAVAANVPAGSAWNFATLATLLVLAGSLALRQRRTNVMTT